MRRAFADRARYLGDPDFDKDMPIAALISKDYAADAAQDDQPEQGVEVVADARSSGRTKATRRRTSRSSTAKRNAVSMTYTLEHGYGSKIVVPGAGFLLNNEMGDFNAGARADRRATALIGTQAEPRARRASACCRAWRRRSSRRTASCSWSPARPGGRTIINTVLETILNVDRLRHERAGSGGRARASTTSGCPIASTTRRTASRPTRSRSSSGGATRCATAAARAWRR